ncbi:protein of unknown function (plasmid) [Caballeronia sp. S22]
MLRTTINIHPSDFDGCVVLIADQSELIGSFDHLCTAPHTYPTL